MRTASKCTSVLGCGMDSVHLVMPNMVTKSIMLLPCTHIEDCIGIYSLEWVGLPGLINIQAGEGKGLLGMVAEHIICIWYTDITWKWHYCVSDVAWQCSEFWHNPMVKAAHSIWGWEFPLKASWPEVGESPQNQGIPHPQVENGIPRSGSCWASTEETEKGDGGNRSNAVYLTAN